MLHQMTLQSSFADRLGRADSVSPTAQKLFDRARQAHQRKRLGATLMGRGRELLRLDDIAAQITITARHQPVAQTVRLDAIQGSLDKADEFDRDFYPAQERTESRWIRIATAMLRGEALPPVELIQVGDTHFVIDGHHRISAARALKLSHIDAIVTRWETA